MYGGPQDPGRGVYWARRIVAAIVVVLLLVLVVPRACQAFLGSEEEETSSVEPEKSATEEETVDQTEAAPVEGGITGEEISPVEAAQGTYVAEAEVAEIQRDLQAPLGQGFILGGEVNQTEPAVPSLVGAIQPAVQPLPPGPPILPAEPPVVAEPILPAEPPVVTEPILPAEPVVAEPALPAEPVVAQPALPAEPIVLDEPFFLEEEFPFFKEKPVSEGTFSGEARAAAPEQTTVAESAGGGAVAVAGSVSASANSS